MALSVAIVPAALLLWPLINHHHLHRSQRHRSRHHSSESIHCIVIADIYRYNFLVFQQKLKCDAVGQID